MWSAEEQAEVRAAAMAWLAARTHDGLDALSTEEIKDFRFKGEPFPLMDLQRGIRKPAVFSSALSIRTVWSSKDAERPYDDAIGADGRYRYKWRGTDPDHAENRALRAAMLERQPLIWFWGVGTALYQPIYPIFLVGEEPGSHQFVVATDGLQHLGNESPAEEVMRRYIRSETRRRLHQPVFRSMVMRAYSSQCAVCSLGHSQLLDAAHIVEDRHERGIAAVRNGLSLCKIHHAAYDSGILGVRPDLVVRIREDILHEIDGPLLEHGLKALHNQPLRVIPKATEEQPNPELLGVRYERFVAT